MNTQRINGNIIYPITCKPRYHYMKMSKCLLNEAKVCNPPYEEYYYYKVF